MNIHILYRVFLCFAYLLSQCNAICQSNDYSESLGLVAHQPYPIKLYAMETTPLPDIFQTQMEC